MTKGINHYEGKAKRRQRLRNKEDRDVFKSRYYQRQQRQIRDNYFDKDLDGEELYFYDEE